MTQVEPVDDIASFKDEWPDFGYRRQPVAPRHAEKQAILARSSRSSAGTTSSSDKSGFGKPSSVKAETRASTS